MHIPKYVSPILTARVLTGNAEIRAVSGRVSENGSGVGWAIQTDYQQPHAQLIFAVSTAPVQQAGAGLPTFLAPAQDLDDLKDVLFVYDVVIDEIPNGPAHLAIVGTELFKYAKLISLLSQHSLKFIRVSFTATAQEENIIKGPKNRPPNPDAITL